MPRSKLKANDILRPSGILDNLINDYVSGELDDSQNLYRAVVIKIDHVRWSTR